MFCISLGSDFSFKTGEWEAYAQLCVETYNPNEPGKTMD